MATGKQIKHYRLKRGWTLEDLEDASGVLKGSIFALEKRDSERSKFFKPIALAFGLTLEQLSDTETDWPIAGMGGTAPPHLGDGCSCVDTSLGQILESLCNLLTTVDAGTRETAASLLANLARNPHTLDSVCKGLAAVLQPSDHTANRKAA